MYRFASGFPPLVLAPRTEGDFSHSGARNHQGVPPLLVPAGLQSIFQLSNFTLLNLPSDVLLSYSSNYCVHSICATSHLQAVMPMPCFTLFRVTKPMTGGMPFSALSMECIFSD